MTLWKPLWYIKRKNWIECSWILEHFSITFLQNSSKSSASLDFGANPKGQASPVDQKMSPPTPNGKFLKISSPLQKFIKLKPLDGLGPNFQNMFSDDSTNRKSKFHDSKVKFIFDLKIRFCHAVGHEVLTICYMLSVNNCISVNRDLLYENSQNLVHMITITRSKSPKKSKQCRYL